MIVPDDQLSLAIGREGQNARLAAKLTGWKVDIKSETDFSHEDVGDIEEGEVDDGRCAAVLSAGRRCPNASLEGSRFCGLPQHQALARFSTNQVTVLGALSDEEVQVLANPEADDAQVTELVKRAEDAHEEPAEEPDEAPDEEAQAEPAAEEVLEQEDTATEEPVEAEEPTAEAEESEAVEEPAEAEEPEAVEPAEAEEPEAVEEEEEPAEAEEPSSI